MRWTRHLAVITSLVVAASQFSMSAATAAPGPAGAFGTIEYTDQAGGLHPVRGAAVVLRDAADTTTLAETITNDAGRYALAAPVAGDYMVRVETRYGGFTIRNPLTDLVYHLDSPVQHLDALHRTRVDIVGHGILTTYEDFPDAGLAFPAGDALVTGVRFVTMMTGTSPAPVDVFYPMHPPTVTTGADGRLVVEYFDPYNWDILLREYAYLVQPWLPVNRNRGFPDPVDSNLSFYYPKFASIPSAWSEGWAVFFSVWAQRIMHAGRLGIPGVGDLHFTHQQYDIDLEANGAIGLNGSGEDVPASVSRILWDLSDRSRDTGDRLRLSDQMLWDLVDEQHPLSLSDAVGDLLAGSSVDGQVRLGCVLGEQGVAPVPVGPFGRDLRQSSPPTFSWSTGNTPPFPNNSFVVEVYDRQLQHLLLTSPVLTDTTFTPSAAEWNTVLQSSRGGLRWLVRGTQDGDAVGSEPFPPQPGPVTGPYPSCAPRR
ncbi:MAG: hypothetical protein QOD72_3015 [Acidimicrobiaceae bacterium]|jgi:hypothetical protein|nr:hypothetical protein [Acidimicrobiaceae bacterium]